MERALEELFRIENQQRFSVNLPGFTIGGGTGIENIKGHYFKGYGVIFSIPDVTNTTYGFINWSDSDDQDHPEMVFSNEINDTGISINEESILSRITEFLVNYAPSIRLLDHRDRVTVVYGSEIFNKNRFRFSSKRIDINSRENSRVSIYGTRERDQPDKPEIPVISMSITKDDLDAYRSGNLTSSEFRLRITSDVVQPDDQNRSDLNIFANILETELRETQNELFRLNSKPAYLFLQNFGVIYHIDLSRSPAFYIGNVIDNISVRPYELDFTDSVNFFRFNENDFQIDMDSLRFRFRSDFFSEEESKKLRDELELVREKVEEARTRVNEQFPQIMEQQKDVIDRAMDQQREYRQELERQRELFQDPEAVEESLQNHLSIIKELMVDYGRTLTLSPEQSILITIHIPSIQNMELPERVTLTLTKAQLDRYQEGLVSREEALNLITESWF
jgi:hypothetical protein